LQTEIFRQSWQGKSYKQIAKQGECGEPHIKDVASELWKDLSKILNENVRKSNFKAFLERRLPEVVTI
jgi:hypothetical protein